MCDPAIRQSKILIVDDEAHLVTLLRHILGQAGYLHIASTTDPFAAIRLFGESQPDLVVLDLLMPGRSGLSVLAELRALIPPEIYLPILVVTGDCAIETRREALGHGATDFITKPCDPAEMLARIGNLLETRLLHRQLAAQNAQLTNEAAQRREAEAALQREHDGLRESERRYRQLIHALPAAVYVCDSAGRVTLYNEAAAALWGRSPELGKDLWSGSWKVFRPDGSPLPIEECPMAVTLREGRSVRGEEVVIERPDGTRRLVLPYPDPILDASGAIVGAVNMLVDLTDLRQAEEAARAARTEADRANAATGEFLSRMSHELRTPLHAILGYAQLLDMDGHTPEEADNIAQILKAGRRLLALVDEVLESRAAPPPN